MIEACAADTAGLCAALAAEGLPVDDLDGGSARFFVMRDGAGAAIAFGGIDGEGRDRLLRSLVVTEGERGTGVGSLMIAALVDEARRDGVERLWLLTTDAAGFFARHGWCAIDRSAAPTVIAATRQFASLCPDTATLMVRELAL